MITLDKTRLIGPLRLVLSIIQQVIMNTVFILQHVHEFEDGHDDVKMIGVFSSEERARAAQQQVANQPGFRDLPDGFCISEYGIDGPVGWTGGYITEPSGERNAL